MSGERADLSFGKDNFQADIQNPIIEIPAEAASRTDALGEIKITAQRGQVDQGSGNATFSGNARAQSVGGTNAFDLTAPTFIIARGGDGTLSTIQTRGKTNVKYDLPPDPRPTTSANGLGTPTHVEVTSDGATFNRATGKATFAGNVSGFYRLQTATGPQNYPFSGEQAVIGFNPTAASTQSGLNVELTGPPAQISTPEFEF